MRARIGGLLFFKRMWENDPKLSSSNSLVLRSPKENLFDISLPSVQIFTSLTKTREEVMFEVEQVDHFLGRLG